MAWYDEEDDPENAKSAIAVANELQRQPSEDEEYNQPRAPETVAPAPQPVAAEDDTAQQMAEYNQPREATPVVAAGPSAEPADAMLYSQPLKPPTMPTFEKYPEPEAAQALATQEGQFAADVKADKFKPSGWRRLGAALAGGAITFGSGNPTMGNAAVESILRAPLNKAQKREDLTEAAMRQGVSAEQAHFEAINRRNQNAASTYNIGRQGYADQFLAEQRQAHAADWRAQAELRQKEATFVPYDESNPAAGGWYTNTLNKRVDNVSPPDKLMERWNANPENKAHAQTMESIARLKEMKANGIKLTAEQEAIVASGGQLRAAPRTTVNMGSAEQQLQAKWEKTFTAENGHPPTAADWMIYKHGTGRGAGMSDSLIQQIKNKKDKAETLARQTWGTGNPTSLQADLQAAQDDFEQDISTHTHDTVPHVTVTVDAQGNVKYSNPDGNVLPAAGQSQPQAPTPAASAAPAAAPAPPAPAAPAPAPPQNPGKQLDVATARKFLQQAGGDRNKARLLAKQQGYTF